MHMFGWIVKTQIESQFLPQPHILVLPDIETDERSIQKCRANEGRIDALIPEKLAIGTEIWEANEF